MAEALLPDFPVDDETLSLLELHLDPPDCQSCGGGGLTGGSVPETCAECHGTGAAFSLTGLLDVLSGYDPSKSRPATPDDFGDGASEWQLTDVTIYEGAIYHPYDVIRSLLAEVRRMRARRRWERVRLGAVTMTTVIIGTVRWRDRVLRRRD